MAFMQADRGWVAEHVFGDYVTATARYRESLATYQRIGNLDGAASAVGFIASVQMKRGEYRAAEATLRTASGVGRRPVAAAAARLSASLMLVTMRRWMGDLDGARLELDRITAFADSLDRPQRQITLARIALARGDLALAFNRLDEAERGFEQARLIAGGVANERTRNELLAQAQVSTARVHYERGDFPRARLVLEDLLARNTSTPIDAAKLWLQLGGAAQRSGDTAAARRAFVQALDQLRTARAPLTEAAAFRRLGDLEAVAGYGVAAESLYRRALSHLGDSRADPELAFTVRAELARVLRSRGALDDAAGELYAAITEIERISGGLRREQDRSDYLSDKWEAYVELALVERQRGRVEDAFATSERLRARQLLDLLARGRPGERDAQRGLRNREQDLRRQIVELARQAGSGGERVTALRDPAPVEGAPDEVSEALVRARQAYGELLTEMNAVDPSYAAVVRGEVATARDVRQALAPDEALLEYLVGESTTVVFVITRDTLAALDLNLSHRSLAELVDFARTAIGSAPRGSSGLRAAWRAPMRRLYQQLLAPVEASGLLARKRRLRIAPHAELHYLPFAALLRPGPPEQQLIERYTIEHVPSASVWLRLRNRPAPGRGSGVLVLTPRGASLPGSQAEAAAIRRIYGTRARSLVGVAASEGAFRQLAPTQEIIHLATYGVLNKVNPLFSFVELGAGGEEDGRLEVHEVFGLTLNARLVVLSACQTGVAAGTLADVPPGDDWVGMVQAFLYAGSANVLATLWPIEDRATARLMERFYLALAEGRSEAEALALAQRAAARDATTAHPFYWAGFALVGGN
jgi:CHAT domain-containing protein/Tfp pilus assembly protein PilF